MACCWNLYIVILTLMMMKWKLILGGIFKHGPSDTVLVQGKTAVLRCAVKTQGNEVVYWFHVDSGQYISYDENIYSFVMEDRYSIIGNHKKGEYYLTIRSARKSDKGEYRCVYGNQFISARMVVLVPPNDGSPACEVLPAADTTSIGNVAQLSCTSQGGDPPAELSWYREDKLIAGPTVHANSVQRLVKQEDNGVLFTCSATTPALTYPRTCTVMVLKNPPMVTVTPPEVNIKHGETAQFTCRGTAETNVTGYRWFINYVVVGSKVSSPRYTLDPTNTTLTIHNVQAWENGVIVSCEANIQSGLKGRGSANLAVILPPNFKTASPPISNNGNEGNGTRLSPKGLHPQPFMTTNIAAIAGASAGALVLLIVVSTLAACCAKGKHKYPAGKNTQGSLRYKTSQQILIEEDFPIYAKPMKVKRLNCGAKESSRPNSNSTTAESALTSVILDVGHGVAIPLCLRPPSLKRLGRKITSNYEKIGFDGPLPLTRPEPMGSEDKDSVPVEGSESARPTEIGRSQNNATNGDLKNGTSKPGELVYADLDLKENNNDSAAKQTQPNGRQSDGVAYAKLRL